MQSSNPEVERFTNEPKAYINPEVERFMKHVDCDTRTGCWLWTGRVTYAGYGQWGERRPDDPHRLHTAYAHRWIYAFCHGPIPAGYDVDHLCRVPGCVNPAHLEAVTRSENMLRIPKIREHRQRTYCNSGRHLRTPEHIYIAPNGQEVCRLCRAEWRARLSKRNAAINLAAK